MSGESGNEDSFFDEIHDIQLMGFMNAVRTGNPTVDMLVTILFPFILKFLLDGLGIIWKQVRDALKRKRNCSPQRRIVYKSNRDVWGDVCNEDEDTQNSILIKAIDMYLHSKGKLTLKKANVDLASTEDKNADIGQQNHNYYYYDSDDEGEGEDDEEDNALVGALSKYRIVHKPPVNEWHNIGKYGKKQDDKDADWQEATVWLFLEQDFVNGTKDSKYVQTVKTYTFESKSGSAIDAFIEAAYQWYLDELRKLEDNSRYFYEMKSSGQKAGTSSDDGGGTSGPMYTRYCLSEEKTFDSLFFREKDSLLKLIQHFTKRTGKYQIPGYPHKLGLLLSGCPGSGKTSFIKALAQHTGRSIVNVPLARVKTNAELMSIFFNPKKYVEGEKLPGKLGFNDVIFVMEDVDAASDVVKRRDGKLTRDDEDAERDSPHVLSSSDLPTPKPVWQLLLESNESDCKSLVKKLIEKSERLKEEATEPSLLIQTVLKMGALPGLGLVGGATLVDSNVSENGVVDPSTMEKIGADAVCTANRIMKDTSTVDRFLATQARILLTRIDQGAAIDDELVDALLGENSFEQVCMGKFKTGECNPGMTAKSKPDHLGDCPSPSGSLDISEIVGSIGDGILAAAIMKSQQVHADGMTTPTTAQSTDTSSSGRNSFVSSNSNSDPSQHQQQHDKKNSKTSGALSSFSFASSSWLKPERDQLNLSGLLNVLDGVVDSPGRILIMTTNHVEHLDPALIRPGRIDKKMFMGYMAPVDVIAMLEHYFQQSLTTPQRERVEMAMNGTAGQEEAREQDENNKGIRQRPRQPLSLTPAQIEQMTAEYDEIEDMIGALEAQSHKKNNMKQSQRGG